MKIATLLILVAGAHAAAAQEDPATRIRRRLEKEMGEALAQTRKSIRELVLQELSTAGIGSAEKSGLAGQIEKFAKNLVNDKLHNRLKELLLSKEGQTLVESFMSEQNMDNLDELVQSYFDKADGKYRVREEFEEVLAQMLDSVAPVEPGKAGTLAPALGLRFAPSAEGLKITDVTEGGPAARAKLQKDDVLLSIGGKQLSASNVDEVLKALAPKTELLVTYSRGKATLSTSLTLDERRPK